MKHLSLYALMVVVAAGISLPCEALEFTAERLSRTGQEVHHARIFYRDHMWRLEYNEPGAVSATIVRADRNQVWHLIPSIHHFRTESYGSDYALHLTIRLDNETSREFIGTQTLDGHPTTLYEVVATGPGGQKETYYQWVATDMNFPLKLVKKDGDWMVEYRDVKLGRLADSFFQLPHRYVPMEP